MNRKLNLLGPQNAVRCLPTGVGLGYFRQVLLRGTVTSSSDRTRVRHFAALHECGNVYKTRMSRLKIFVSVFLSVRVTANIPSGNRMQLYP